MLPGRAASEILRYNLWLYCETYQQAWQIAGVNWKTKNGWWWRNHAFCLLEKRLCIIEDAWLYQSIVTATTSLLCHFNLDTVCSFDCLWLWFHLDAYLYPTETTSKLMAFEKNSINRLDQHYNYKQQSARSRYLGDISNNTRCIQSI